ncbi:RHS repeat domain-containing protein [Snodgrassella communis]|uniref:RHS repeat domain-containing protein n=1 Tax=Snodgrassella communis TaxID=2946699 RepID=UPI0035B5069C
MNHRYVREYLDEACGFYHLIARDYDPKIGRFISRDSFEGVKNNPITLKSYLYANTDPCQKVDKSHFYDINKNHRRQISWSKI